MTTAGMAGHRPHGALATAAVGPAPVTITPAGRWSYWLCQLLGWSLCFGWNLSVGLLAAQGTAPVLAAIYLWSAASGLALSHGWRQLLRRRGWLASPGQSQWPLLLAGLPLLTLLQTGLVAIAFALARPRSVPITWSWLPIALTAWLVVFVLWTLLYGAARLARRARQLQLRTLALELASNKAELRALQAQVHPHFFFNSLNSLRGLIFENQEAAARMVDQLATLMRHTLQSGQTPTVPLAQELAAVHAYLAVEAIRFEHRLCVAEVVAPGLDAVPVPPMLLQTLVENAVKHGIERLPDGGTIRLSAHIDASDVNDGGRPHVLIRISNDGSLATLSASTRVGLDNARQRLQLACGHGARLDLRASDGQVHAVLRLPVAP